MSNEIKKSLKGNSLSPDRYISKSTLGAPQGLRKPLLRPYYFQRGEECAYGSCSSAAFRRPDGEGEPHQLCDIADLDLLHDVLLVNLDRPSAYAEGRGDLLGMEAGGGELQYLAFAGSQRGQFLGIRVLTPF